MLLSKPFPSLLQLSIAGIAQLQGILFRFDITWSSNGQNALSLAAYHTSSSSSTRQHIAAKPPLLRDYRVSPAGSRIHPSTKPTNHDPKHHFGDIEVLRFYLKLKHFSTFQTTITSNDYIASPTPLNGLALVDTMLPPDLNSRSSSRSHSVQHSPPLQHIPSHLAANGVDSKAEGITRPYWQGLLGMVKLHDGSRSS